MAYENIDLSFSGPVARLRLHRPETRNAMTAAMGEEIRSAVGQINRRPDVRVVVVTGSGKAFSAGGNLDDLIAEVEGRAEEGGPGLGGGERFYSLFLSVRDLEVPSIAAINGHAIGAGLCFALGCDLRVMREGAKVGMTFVRLGIHPGMAATWTLPRLIGESRAADLLFTGRLVEAREALGMGLVDRVAGDDFEQVVDELAAEICSSGPLAVRAVKGILRGTRGRTLEEALAVEAEAQRGTFRTADAAEGIRAIREKRAPRFEGR